MLHDGCRIATESVVSRHKFPALHTQQQLPHPLHAVQSSLTNSHGFIRHFPGQCDQHTSEEVTMFKENIFQPTNPCFAHVLWCVIETQLGDREENKGHKFVRTTPKVFRPFICFLLQRPDK